jgi:hypothetical protein
VVGGASLGKNAKDEVELGGGGDFGADARLGASVEILKGSSGPVPTEVVFDCIGTRLNCSDILSIACRIAGHTVDRE